MIHSECFNTKIDESVLFSADEEEVKQDPPKNADRLDRRGTLSENDPKFVLQTEDGGKFYINTHRNIKTPANSNH